MAIINGNIHYKWPFSIATLNYQRVLFSLHTYAVYAVAAKLWHALTDRSDRLVTGMLWWIFPAPPFLGSLKRTLKLDLLMPHVCLRHLPSRIYQVPMIPMGWARSILLYPAPPPSMFKDPRWSKQCWFTPSIRSLCCAKRSRNHLALCWLSALDRC